MEAHYGAAHGVFGAELRAPAAGTGVRRRFVHTGAFWALAKAYVAARPGGAKGKKVKYIRERKRERNCVRLKVRRSYENQLFVRN